MRAVWTIVMLWLLACDHGDVAQGSGLAENAPDFPGELAHQLIAQQVAFGPRAPGMPGHAAQLEWMTQYLRERADTVILQPFTHATQAGTELALTNVLARFRPDAADRVLLVAHWDTRPTADQDTGSAVGKPIPGANDGGSGTAVLLALAGVLADNEPPIGVDLLLVDGEDYAPGEMYLGATYFAANLPAGYRPLYGILLDMIGDQDPEFPIEGYSLDYAPEVVDRVWRTASEIGYGHLFPRRTGISVSDDHIPLNQAGIRTIDIIDFDYPYWHTLQDDVQHTSAAGLEAVGEVVTVLIYSGG